MNWQLLPKQRKILLEESMEDIKEYDGNEEQYNWVESLLEGESYSLY